MATRPTHRIEPQGERPIDWTLWFSVGAGPAAWSLHLLTCYPLASLIMCETGWLWLLHALSILFALVALAGAAAGWRAWRGTEESGDTSLHGVGGRPGFMAMAGIVFSLLGFVGVLFGWAVVFTTDPCV